MNRITYEICVLQTLREKLRCKEIWVVGADLYRNPDDDLPADFEPHRGTYSGFRLAGPRARREPAFVAPREKAIFG